MASKSDSPNMVVHPGNYVKIDVIFREGAACFKQALAFPFRARFARAIAFKKALRERILARWVTAEP